MNDHETEICKAACCIAGIDGEICHREHPLLQRMATGAGADQQWLTDNLDRALNDRLYYKRQFHLLQENAEETMTTLIRIARIDGHVSAPEAIILQHFAKKIGMDAERYQQLLEETAT